MLRTLPILTVLAIALWALPPRCLVARAEGPDALVVIIARSVAITDISLAQLRQAFAGERAETASGVRLIPLNLAPNTPERQLFDRAVLGLEPDEVGRFWIKRRMRDEGLAPRRLPSAQMGVRVVAALPGAITYVPAGLVDGPVRRLTIDGKAPGQPGYLLAAP